MRITRRAAAGWLIAAFGVAAPVASYATDTVTFINDSGSTGVTIHASWTGNSRTDYTTAGSYNFSINGGPTVQGYCTDLFDVIYSGESWQANPTHTSAPDGLANAPYPVLPTSQNIRAIDYIAQSTLSAHNSSEAAQLAIWDLGVNSGVSDVGGTYSWGSNFSADGSSQSLLQNVYNLEQAGLSQRGGSGSILEKIASYSAGSRPQDIAFAAPVPEAGTVFSFGSMVLAGGLGFLRARRRR